MNCPIDGTTLLMSERNGIEIDYCPQCRGVWLDRGELDKILERAQAVSEEYAAPAPGAAPQQAAVPRYDDGRDRRRDDYRDDRAGRPDPSRDRRDGGYGGGYDDRRRKKRESPFEFLGDLFG